MSGKPVFPDHCCSSSAVRILAYASSGSFESLSSSRHLARIDLRAVDRQRGCAEVCEALHLPAESTVYYVATRLVGDAGPIAHMRAFLSVAVGARLRPRALRSRLLQEILVTLRERCR